MALCWRGRKDPPDQPQLANGGIWDLSPASEEPAQRQLANWAATLPDTDQVPLIWDKEMQDDRERPEEDLQHF